MKKQGKIWLIGPAAVLVPGLWHYGDVRVGAAASGDAWLTGWYGLLFAAALCSALAVGWMLFEKRKGKELRLWQIYPAVGLVLGLLYLAVLPPLSAPDEVAHYISAYKLSSRLIGQPVTAEDGHVLVRAQDWFLEDVYGNYEIDMSGQYWVKTGEKAVLNEDGSRADMDSLAIGADGRMAGLSVVLGQELTEATYRSIHDVMTGVETPQQKLAEETAQIMNAKAGGLVTDTKWIDANQTDAGQANAGRANAAQTEIAVSPFPDVVTTPAAYLPQAIGISLARLLHLNSLWLVWLGRLFNLMFFVAMVWIAMRWLPLGQEVLFGVSLLPMTLHLSASFSYDVMIMGCMFLFAAVCLDLAFAREKVRVRDVAVLALLMAVAGPCKMVYAAMMGLCLLIPVKKFGGWGRWLLSAVAVAGAWAVVMVLVNGQVVAGYAAATEAEAVLADTGEAGFSLMLLLHRPGLLLQMFYNTLAYQLDEYHLSMIGAQLGNLDPVLNVPYLIVALFTVGLIVLALRKPGESLVLVGVKRVWVWVVCAMCAAAAMLSMLIACTPITSIVIEGVQGRYFLPFLPILLMTCKNDGLVLTKNTNRSIVYLMCCANFYVLLRLFATVCMRL